MNNAQKKGIEDEEDYLLKILSYYNQFLKFNDHKNKMFVIDTENLSQEEVLKKIEYIMIKKKI